MQLSLNHLVFSQIEYIYKAQYVLFSYSKIGRNIHFNLISMCSSENVAATSNLTWIWIGCSSVAKIKRTKYKYTFHRNKTHQASRVVDEANDTHSLWYSTRSSDSRWLTRKMPAFSSQCGRPIKIRKIIMCFIYIGHNVRECWSYCYVESAYRTNISDSIGFFSFFFGLSSSLHAQDDFFSSHP